MAVSSEHKYIQEVKNKIKTITVCVYFGVTEREFLSADNDVVGCDSNWNTQFRFTVCLFH